jgi:hypothetical protein
VDSVKFRCAADRFVDSVKISLRPDRFVDSYHSYSGVDRESICCAADRFVDSYHSYSGVDRESIRCAADRFVDSFTLTLVWTGRVFAALRIALWTVSLLLWCEPGEYSLRCGSLCGQDLKNLKILPFDSNPQIFKSSNQL